MMPKCLKNLVTSEIEKKIYIYMVNEAFNDLPEWMQKSEELLTKIEELPDKQKRRKAILKAANIIMSDNILKITKEEIASGKWL